MVSAKSLVYKRGKIMKAFATRTQDFKNSIFAVMSQKAVEHQAINLAQGFPNFDGPSEMAESAFKNMQDGHNQYASFAGVEVLRKAIASYYQRFYSLEYDSGTSVTVTVGATEGIFATIMALVGPGDEVVVFEPFYDSYIASIKMAHGIPKIVTLAAPEFKITSEALSAAITNKTKLIILNNPHNPTGRVFDDSELQIVCGIAKKHDLYVLSDEVYEFLTYDGIKHTPIASFVGMQERVITISSAGKTFGMTGWKVGWITSSPEISDIIRKVHQYITFSVTTPLQHAVAESLNNLEKYLPEFRSTYQAKRNYFYQAMQSLGYKFPKPAGTYFMMVPITGHTQKSDIDYCMELIETKKVASIPPSAFYLKSDDGSKYLRFCFAKTGEVLAKAIENLNLL